MKKSLDGKLKTSMVHNYCNFHMDQYIVSSRVSAPPWNIDLNPFYLGSPNNYKSVRCQTPPPLPFLATPLEILENLTPSLEMYTHPKKAKLFCKEFYFQQWNKNAVECWNINIELAKSKNQKRVRRLLSIFFLLGSYGQT